MRKEKAKNKNNGGKNLKASKGQGDSSAPLFRRPAGFSRFWPEFWPVFWPEFWERALPLLLLIFKGALMGLSAILPGVSGGTMAFILGLYQKLINEIAKFRVRHAKVFLSFFSFRGSAISKALRFFLETYDWKFLMPLMAGAALSLAAFAAAAPPLIEARPLEFHSLIFGFVLASLFPLLKEMKKNFRVIALLLISFAAHFLFFYLTGSLAGEEEPRAGGLPPSSFFWFAPAGFLAALAMIVPGLSGSYLLILMGLYRPFLEALNRWDFAAIACFAFGGVFGIFLMARWIKRLLESFFHESLAVIAGLILGSLYAVWPFPGESPFSVFSFWLFFGPEQKIFFLWFGGAFAFILALGAAPGIFRKKPLLKSRSASHEPL